MMDNKWRIIDCSTCGGHGINHYSAPFVCRECGGDGYFYIRPSGHLFAYPGGPGQGMASPRDYAHARLLKAH
jgi:hypothetical protein